MAKMGRPRIAIDQKKLEDYLKLYPSEEDCAHLMDCSVDALAKYIKKTYSVTFNELREKMMGSTRAAIKRAQLRKAIEGENPTMLIWVGKQYLSQSDQIKLDVNATTTNFNLSYKLDKDEDSKS
jgi:hypothetical protein